MNQITLTLQNTLTSPVDFSHVRLDRWAAVTEDEIRQTRLQVNGSAYYVSDFWKVSVRTSDDTSTPRLVLQGNHGAVNGLGHQHRVGEILVEGDIGANCGSCMTGGSIVVCGNAADELGAPIGTRAEGMNGGVLRIKGNAGDLAGHRMRRGEIVIDGNVDAGLASWQVAGTIRVGGAVGKNAGLGMRRGTLILKRAINLPELRFTNSVELRTPFSALAGMVTDECWRVRRGDRSVGGIGEVWMPASVSDEARTANNNLLTIRR